MTNKIKVRFNLGAGKHFMKWKIEGPLGVEYHHPDQVQLVLAKCKIKNNKKTAQKIFDGVHKTVCAWVLCESISINYLDSALWNLQTTNNTQTPLLKPAHTLEPVYKRL